MHPNQINYYIDQYKRGRFDEVIAHMDMADLNRLTAGIDEGIKRVGVKPGSNSELEDMYLAIVNERIKRMPKAEAKPRNSNIEKARRSQESELNALEAGEYEPRKVRITPWKDFVGQDFEEPKWIVKEMIPEKGLVAVAGSPESYKSFFTLYLAIMVAQGLSVLDRYETTKTPVLLIDQESIASWLHKRLMELSNADDLPIFIFDKDETPFDILDDNIFDQLLDFINDNNIGLVIIDTLRMAHSREENSSTEMKPIVDKLKELASHAAVLFIHHHRKTDKFSRNKSSGEDMMGSIFIRGSVDYQHTLTNLGEQPDGVSKIKVAQTKARYTKPIKSFEMTLEEQDEHLIFAYKGEADDEKQKKDDAKERIKQILENTRIKRQEIIDQLVEEDICSARTVEQALKELVEGSVVKHTTTRPHIYSLALEDIVDNPIPLL